MSLTFRNLPRSGFLLYGLTTPSVSTRGRSAAGNGNSVLVMELDHTPDIEGKGQILDSQGPGC